MANYTEEQIAAKRIELMEKCYDGLAELGLHGTGVRTLGKHCGYNPTMIYTYFKDLDDLIIQSTAHCMSKVEEEFMSIAPQSADMLERFIDEVPYWTAKNHGKKYRLMYQVYTHPKYREYGKVFFDGVNERYTEYAKQVAENIGLPSDVVRPMIFVLVRACVHYALFEDDFYLREQLKHLKLSIELYTRAFAPEKNIQKALKGETKS